MRRCAFLLPALLLAAGCASTGSLDSSYDVSPAAETAVTAPKAFRAKAKRKAAFSAGMRVENSADNSTFKAPAGRKMTYSTRLVINVPDTVKGVKKASSIAEKYTGYVVYSDNSTANIKIPVAKALAALKEFETIGSTTSKTITANDITDHYTDTQVRLDNLRRLQKRLSELLSRAVKVDEIIRIERELSRVTTELERYQARMNILTKQVEMVDFNLSFNAVVTPNEIPRTIIPAAWVRKLGIAIRKQAFTETGFNDDIPICNIDLPSGFAVTHSTKHSLQAANSDNVVVEVIPYNNLSGADLLFYQNLIEKQLKYAGYTRVVFKKDKTARGTEFLSVSAVSGNYHLAVMVAIYTDGWLCKDEKVAVAEMYGPADAMKKIDLNKFYRSFEF